MLPAHCGRAVVFAAVGTAGQRCTTCRRLFVQESIYDSFVEKLVKSYAQVKIGNPLEEVLLSGIVHLLLNIFRELFVAPFTLSRL